MEPTLASALGGYNLGALPSLARVPPPRPRHPHPALAAVRDRPNALRATAVRRGPTACRMRQCHSRPRYGLVSLGDSYSRHAWTFTRRNNAASSKTRFAERASTLSFGRMILFFARFGDLFRIGQEIMRSRAQGPGSHLTTERFCSPSKGDIGLRARQSFRDNHSTPSDPARGVHCRRERGDILFS